MTKEAMNIIGAIEKMHLGQHASGLSRAQIQKIWDECDELLTGNSCRTGIGSTQKNTYEYRTPRGEYFELDYYDSGRLDIIRGSHW